MCLRRRVKSANKQQMRTNSKTLCECIACAVRVVQNAARDDCSLANAFSPPCRVVNPLHEKCTERIVIRSTGTRSQSVNRGLLNAWQRVVVQSTEEVRIAIRATCTIRWLDFARKSEQTTTASTILRFPLGILPSPEFTWYTVHSHDVCEQ